MAILEATDSALRLCVALSEVWLGSKVFRERKSVALMLLAHAASRAIYNPFWDWFRAISLFCVLIFMFFAALTMIKQGLRLLVYGERKYMLMGMFTSGAGFDVLLSGYRRQAHLRWPAYESAMEYALVLLCAALIFLWIRNRMNCLIFMALYAGIMVGGRLTAPKTYHDWMVVDIVCQFGFISALIYGARELGQCENLIRFQAATLDVLLSDPAGSPPGVPAQPAP